MRKRKRKTVTRAYVSQLKRRFRAGAKLTNREWRDMHAFGPVDS